MHVVTLIPGDGIGPEITKAVTDIFTAAQVPIQWEEQNAGQTTFDQSGELIPTALLKSLEKNKVALKGPITTPVGKGFRLWGGRRGIEGQHAGVCTARSQSLCGPVEIWDGPSVDQLPVGGQHRQGTGPAIPGLHAGVRRQRGERQNPDRRGGARAQRLIRNWWPPRLRISRAGGGNGAERRSRPHRAAVASQDETPQNEASPPHVQRPCHGEIPAQSIARQNTSSLAPPQPNGRFCRLISEAENRD